MYSRQGDDQRRNINVLSNMTLSLAPVSRAIRGSNQYSEGYPTHVEITDVDPVHVVPELETAVVSSCDQPGRVYPGIVSLDPGPGGFQVDEVAVRSVQSVICTRSGTPGPGRTCDITYYWQYRRLRYWDMLEIKCDM